VESILHSNFIHFLPPLSHNAFEGHHNTIRGVGERAVVKLFMQQVSDLKSSCWCNIIANGRTQTCRFLKVVSGIQMTKSSQYHYTIEFAVINKQQQSSHEKSKKTAWFTTTLVI
jgi:hypothetical protein